MNTGRRGRDRRRRRHRVTTNAGGRRHGGGRPRPRPRRAPAITAISTSPATGFTPDLPSGGHGPAHDDYYDIPHRSRLSPVPPIHPADVGPGRRSSTKGSPMSGRIGRRAAALVIAGTVAIGAIVVAANAGSSLDIAVANRHELGSRIVDLHKLRQERRIAIHKQIRTIRRTSMDNIFRLGHGLQSRPSYATSGTTSIKQLSKLRVKERMLIRATSRQGRRRLRAQRADITHVDRDPAAPDLPGRRDARGDRRLRRHPRHAGHAASHPPGQRHHGRHRHARSWHRSRARP